MNFVKVSLMFGGLVGLGVIGYLSDKKIKFNRGYCFAQGRYLSESEFVDIAVDKLIGDLASKYKSFTPNEQKTVFQYASRDDFYQQNPFCCFNEIIDHKTNPNQPAFEIYEVRNHYGHALYTGRIYFLYHTAEPEKLSMAEYTFDACGSIMQDGISLNYQSTITHVKKRTSIDRRD